MCRSQEAQTLRNSDSCSKQHHQMPIGPPSVTLTLELNRHQSDSDVSEQQPHSHPTRRQTAIDAYTKNLTDPVRG